MQAIPPEDKADNQQAEPGQGAEAQPQGEESTEVSIGATPPPQAGTGTSPNKNWFVIGGAGVGALVVLILVAAAAFYFTADDGPPGAGSLLGLVPADVEYIAIWDVAEMLEGDILEGFSTPDPDDWLGSLSAPLGRELGLEPTNIEQYVQTLVGRSEVEMVSGEFEFDDLRNDLDRQGYDDSSYRGYEVWTGWRTYALLEKEGFIITGDTEDAVEEILNNLYRGGESLGSAREEDLARIVRELGQAPALVATTNLVVCQVRRCQGIGIAVTGYNIADEEATGEFRMLFSSERAAEAAADEYDDVSDFYENWINFDIYDAEVDGEFVRGTGTGERAFLNAID